MSRGWDAVTVDHELTALGTAHTVDGYPLVEAIPGAPLVVEVEATNHGEHGQPGRFRLTGLGVPLFADADAVVPNDPPQRRQLAFALPARVDPGRNPVTIEWIRAGDGSIERLAVTDLVVEVDDVSSTRIEVTPRLIKGLLGDDANVLLENTGTASVRLALTASVPQKSRLRIHLTPETVVLEPGQIVTATAHVQRRSRWFGASRTHVYDVHARAASGTVTGTGTFRQYTVLPPWLFKAIASIAAIVLAVVLLLRLVRAVVDDSSPATWTSVADAPDDLVARADHTSTWMSFERRDASTGTDGAPARARELVLGTDDSIRGVLVWGGQDGAGRAVSSGAIYSVTDGEWLAVESLPGEEARTGHTAVWTGERAVIWGGAVTTSADGGTTAVPTLPTPFYGAEYDPTTDDWDPLPPSGLAPRIGHTMIWTGRELIVFGGVGVDGRPLSDGGILRAGRIQSDGTSTAEDEADLSTGVWSLFQEGDLGAMGAAPRAFHSAAWDGRYMVVSGGVTSDGSLLSDAYAYDVERNRWNLVSLATFEPRACHASVATGTGVAMLGGLGVDDLDDTTGGGGARLLDGGLCDIEVSTERTDPIAWNLVLQPSPDDPRIALYEWQVLADAPQHLGTGFDAAWTGTAVGVALLVPELDSVAPISYVPGSGSTIGALPEQGQLDVRSDLTAAWNGSELFVWGGRTERPCTPTDGEQGCPGSNGAIIDVGP